MLSDKYLFEQKEFFEKLLKSDEYLYDSEIKILLGQIIKVLDNKAEARKPKWSAYHTLIKWEPIKAVKSEMDALISTGKVSIDLLNEYLKKLDNIQYIKIQDPPLFVSIFISKFSTIFIYIGIIITIFTLVINGNKYGNYLLFNSGLITNYWNVSQPYLNIAPWTIGFEIILFFWLIATHYSLTNRIYDLSYEIMIIQGYVTILEIKAILEKQHGHLFWLTINFIENILEKKVKKCYIKRYNNEIEKIYGYSLY